MKCKLHKPSWRSSAVTEGCGLTYFSAQKYEVRLPADFTCANCTLQLQREAAEWGASYRFWSCADIDIVTRKYFACYFS